MKCQHCESSNVSPISGFACQDCGSLQENFIEEDLEAEIVTPINMVLHCPRCGQQHVDEPEPAQGWTNPPHRSHKCSACGIIWRPADVPTNGVAAITTRGKGDTWHPAAMIDMSQESSLVPDNQQQAETPAHSAETQARDLVKVIAGIRERAAQFATGERRRPKRSATSACAWIKAECDGVLAKHQA